MYTGGRYTNISKYVNLIFGSDMFANKDRTRLSRQSIDMQLSQPVIIGWNAVMKNTHAVTHDKISK
jgi:hypothetical protein